jgi:uncharacterized protein YdaU (DUF1376 family)
MPPKPAKPPAFQFYARDWLSSTLGMPWDVMGLYIHLIAWSWDNGPLPDDPRWRRRIIGSDAKTAAKLWAALERRWEKTARGWINPRLEHQRRLLNSYRAHAQHAAGMRWASIGHAPGHRLGMAGAHAQTMPNRCTASSSASSSSDQDQPAASRPVSVPPFKIYAAIARQAFAEADPDDLSFSGVAEVFKKKCAAQGFPYDAALTTKALHAATAARARRRA